MGERTRHLIIMLLCASLCGCGLFSKRKPLTPSGPDPTSPRAANDRVGTDLVAMVNGSGREQTLPDPATMIPPRPNINIPDIPDAPPKDDRIVAAPQDTANPPIKQVAAVKNVEEKAESANDALQRLRHAAHTSFNKLPGFTAKLTRRETVAGSPHSEEVLQYKFRASPYSMHLRWIGREAQGRELVYVANTKEDKVHILTARGDGSLLMPAGKRFAFAPTASEIRSQARYDIREGGMGLTVIQFCRLVDLAENDPKAAKRLRYVGKQQRREHPAPLELVEDTIPPNAEPLLPKGGKRQLYFDADPQSPSYGLPILVMAFSEGREVEYYHFDQFQPATFADADFDSNRLWRK